MRYQFLALIFTFFINESTLAQNKINLSTSLFPLVSKKTKPYYQLSDGQKEDLVQGHVVSYGKVDSPTEKEQRMTLFVSGIHGRNCKRVMRKLSLYENYNNYMDFIKTSEYDEQNQKFSFSIDHALLPFPMIVKFKIPRITDEGQYPFIFEDGFLKDLKGTIIVQNIGKYCLLGLKSDWKGPKTKMPDFIFGTFVQTIGKLGLEHLIRVSQF